MPPHKTAAKKTAKKAAKKVAGRHHDKHHHAKDLRRAFEHMGRLHVLQPMLKPSAAESIGELTKLAQQKITSSENKDAADLLRAAEHLGFAALAGAAEGETRVSAELKEAIAEQFDELMRRADEHRGTDGEGTLEAVYQGARRSASKAYKDGVYHQALEFARAAEALLHVAQEDQKHLDAGKRQARIGKG